MPPARSFHASGVAMQAAAYSSLKGLPTSWPAAHCPSWDRRKRSRSTMSDTISGMLCPPFEGGIAKAYLRLLGVSEILLNRQPTPLIYLRYVTCRVAPGERIEDQIAGL